MSGSNIVFNNTNKDVINLDSEDESQLIESSEDDVVAVEENMRISECEINKISTDEDDDGDDADKNEDLFKIDTEPAIKHDTVLIPSYKRTIKDVLVESSNKTKKSTDECCRPKKSSMCFNCSAAGHGLKDCPKPRNQKKINQAKKLLISRQERYHVDNEQRFAHLRPGKISQKLKSAMGLRKGELPFFFYRMRVLGYPPGWLEDAKVAHSGIALFNSEGQQVLESDDEEGQIQVNKCKYDASKIIGFPGFNVDPGSKFFDDFNYHQVPPLNPCDRKEDFIKMLGDNVIKGYKRRKLKDLSSSGTNNESVGGLTTDKNLQESDMEIEDEFATGQTGVEVIFTRPLPPSEPPQDTALPPPPAENPPFNETRESSPTLEDLEAQQKKLLRELQSNTSTDNTYDSLVDEIIELDSENDSIPENDETEKSTTKSSELTGERFFQTSSPKTPLSKTNELTTPATKESHLGTPILKFSPFDKLPCGDQFKVGVSEVINFENLPDSTGKFKQMKEVIEKVRKTITKLYSEED